MSQMEPQSAQPNNVQYKKYRIREGFHDVTVTVCSFQATHHRVTNQFSEHHVVPKVEQMQQQAQTGLNDIANQVAAGTMTQQQALQGLSDLANSTQQSFNELLEQSLPVLQNYIPGHPQFELDGLSQAMQYMVSHPDAISQMNQGMVDVTALGESLGGLTFDQVQALENLPSDLATTLFGAASAAALVTSVNTNMQPGPKNKETNSELFRMVEEFSEKTNEGSYKKSA